MRFLALFSVLMFSISAVAQNAQGLSNEQQDALRKTQELLRDKNQRQRALEVDPKAKAQDASIDKSFGGDQNKQRAYEISADVFGSMVQETGGDDAKIQKMLQDAQANPEAFYNNMTPEQRQQIRELANQISPQPQMKQPPAAR